MNTHDVLARLEILLEEEREAIRKLDGTVVESLAIDKLALVQKLNIDELREEPETAARFASLAHRLRNNAVILAHARNCLRDVVRMQSAPVGTYGHNGKLAANSRRRVSITG